MRLLRCAAPVGLSRLLVAGGLGGLDLGAEVIQRHVELAVAERRLRFRRLLVRTADYLLLALMVRQVICLLRIQLEDEAVVGSDAPFLRVFLVALGVQAVEVSTRGT